MSAWGGISSVQLGLPLFWTEGRRRGFGLADVNRLMACNTARLAGLDNRDRDCKVAWGTVSGYHQIWHRDVVEMVVVDILLYIIDFCRHLLWNMMTFYFFCIFGARFQT